MTSLNHNILILCRALSVLNFRLDVFHHVSNHRNEKKASSKETMVKTQCRLTWQLPLWPGALWEGGKERRDWLAANQLHGLWGEVRGPCGGCKWVNSTCARQVMEERGAELGCHVMGHTPPSPSLYKDSYHPTSIYFGCHRQHFGFNVIYNWHSF